MLIHQRSILMTEEGNKMTKDIMSLLVLGVVSAISVVGMLVSFVFGSWVCVAVCMVIAVISSVAFFYQVCDMEGE